MHKGFKCLDPTEGRVYISHDVTFDECVFPFAELHPNAGARLRSEISLLPDALLNSSSNFGDAILLDHAASTPVPINPSTTSARSSCAAREKAIQNDPDLRKMQQYFMQSHGDKVGTESQADLAAPVSLGLDSGAGESFWGSALAMLSPETVGASPSSRIDADACTGGSSMPHLGPLPLATGIAQTQPDSSAGDRNPADRDAAAGSPMQAAGGSYASSPLAEEPVQ
jgi:hypothetical protein